MGTCCSSSAALPEPTTSQSRLQAAFRLIEEDLLNIKLCTFHFLPREVFFEERVMPKFQDLDQRRVLKSIELDFPMLVEGSLAGAHAIISHRWLHPDHPDPEGKQREEICRVLEAHPAVKWLWLDWSCLPQGEKTAEQRAYFRRALMNANVLYLFLPVLVVADEAYLTRFWCLLELFLSRQTFEQGSIRPAAAAALPAAWMGAGRSPEESLRAWENVGVEQAFTQLLAEDIVVTCQSDKLLQVARLKSLEPMLQLLEKFEGFKKEHCHHVPRGATADLATILHQMGEVRAGLGHAEAAMAFYRQAEAANVEVGATATLGYAALLQSMGVNHSDCGRYDEAMQLFVRAEHACVAAGATATRDYARLLTSMGAVHKSRGQYGEAAELFLKAERAFVGAGATATADYAKLLTSMGATHKSRGQYDQAMELFAKAEQAFVAAGATDTVDHAGLLTSMGTNQKSRGRPEQAMELYAKAELAFVAAGATATVDYAGLLRRIGIYQKSCGQHERAQEFYVKAEQAFVAAGAADTLDYAGLLKNMGNNYGERGQYEQATELYAKAALSYAAAGATDTKGYAGLLLDMGISHKKRGQHEEAMEFFVQAEQIYTAAGATATANYGKLLEEMKDVKTNL